MLNRFLFLAAALLTAAVVFPVGTFAQNYPKITSADGWPAPVWEYPPITAQNRKPAPRRDLSGMWGPLGGHMGGVQAGGVLSKPNNGRPENALPYTPYGLEVYKSHKPAEGADAVLPAENNDPRNNCEPLGVPRYNHYNVRLTQIFQDPVKVLIAYHYDNRWRVIWTDGRKLPKMLDGGVEIDGQYREQRIFGYSVGTWIDDNTLEVDDDWNLAGGSGVARFDRPAYQRSGQGHREIPAREPRRARVVGDHRRSEDIYQAVGDDEAPDAPARSSYRSHGVLLLTAGTGELRQVLRKRREPEIG